MHELIIKGIQIQGRDDEIAVIAEGRRLLCSERLRYSVHGGDKYHRRDELHFKRKAHRDHALSLLT